MTLATVKNELDAAAAKLRAANPKLSKEASVAAALEADPRLYQKWEAAAAAEAQKPTKASEPSVPPTAREIVMSRLFGEADALRARSPEELTREQAVSKVLEQKPEYGVVYDRAVAIDQSK